MSNYIVTAPLVIAKNDRGGDLHIYKDSPVPSGQSEGWIKQHLDENMIAEAEEVVVEAVGTVTVPEKPAGNASQEDWQAYAVANGVDEAEASKLSRDELRDRFKE